MTDKTATRNLGTSLNLDDLVGRAEKPPKNLVPKHSPGFIRLKVINGRVYYYHVRTIYTPNGPRQKVIRYYGTSLPKGLRLGPVSGSGLGTC